MLYTYIRKNTRISKVTRIKNVINALFKPIKLNHYLWYFREMGTNFHDNNGEYIGALHYSLDTFEEKNKLKVKRKLGTNGHLNKI